MTSEQCTSCGYVHGTNSRCATCAQPIATSEYLGPEPEWIVNDLGELGVKLGERCFFLYKGRNIEYSGPHEDGTPMLYRMVGKREFGECCHPVSWVRAGRSEDRYTVELTYVQGLSDGQKEDGDWRPLPLVEEKK